MYRLSNCMIVFLVFVLIFYSVSFISYGSAMDAMCDSTTDELIRYNGYEAETHNISTEDGYFLTVFRCYSKENRANNKKPVIVAHGLTGFSDHFVIGQPNQTLVFILADAGHDIWLTNARGTAYSRKHVSKDPDAFFSDFWEFSWYEIGIYDQSAIIDYVLKKTDNSKLYYLGHSQGTTALMVLLSERPEYNAKIQAASLMAPAGYMEHSQLFGFFGKIGPVLNFARNMEYLPKNGIFSNIIHFVCAISVYPCYKILSITGGASNQTNDAVLPLLLCRTPAGSSLKQFLHYGQEAKYGHFGKFMDTNEIPADFQLSKITVPINIHYSTADTLTHPIDVEKLLTKLTNADVTVNKISGIDYNHYDFLAGLDSVPLVFSKILTFFDAHQ